MFEKIFQSVGEVTHVYTLVDFYQYIKGLEYLICIGFFIVFHSFYKHIINPESKDTKPH